MLNPLNKLSNMSRSLLRPPLQTHIHTPFRTQLNHPPLCDRRSVITGKNLLYYATFPTNFVKKIFHNKGKIE